MRHPVIPVQPEFAHVGDNSPFGHHILVAIKAAPHPPQVIPHLFHRAAPPGATGPPLRNIQRTFQALEFAHNLRDVGRIIAGEKPESQVGAPGAAILPRACNRKLLPVGEIARNRAARTRIAPNLVEENLDERGFRSGFAKIAALGPCAQASLQLLLGLAAPERNKIFMPDRAQKGIGQQGFVENRHAASNIGKSHR